MFRITAFVLVLGISGLMLAGESGQEGLILLRGDANMDLGVDGSDAMFITSWLFSGGQEPPCLNQADVNDDGVVDQSDPIYLMNWLYNGGTAPPAPGPYATDCTVLPGTNPGCADPFCP